MSCWSGGPICLHRSNPLGLGYSSYKKIQNARVSITVLGKKDLKAAMAHDHLTFAGFESRFVKESYRLIQRCIINQLEGVSSLQVRKRLCCLFCSLNGIHLGRNLTGCNYYETFYLGGNEERPRIIRSFARCRLLVQLSLHIATYPKRFMLFQAPCP